MKKVLIFEFYKFLMNKKNLFLISLIVILITLKIYSTNQASKLFTENLISDTQGFHDLLNEDYERAKNDLKLLDASGQQDDYITDYIGYAETNLSMLEKQVNALKKGNTKTYWEIEYEKLNYQKDNPLVDESANEGEYVEAEPLRLKLEYLIDNKLPIDSSLQFPSLGWSSSELMLLYISSIIFLLIFFIMFGDISSADFENKSRFLYSTTIKRKGTIIVAKMIVVVNMLVMLSLFALIANLIVSGLMNGWGSYMTPVIIGNFNIGFSTIPMLSYLFKFFVYSLFVDIFLSIIFIFLGIVLKKSLIVIGVIVITYYGFTLVQDNPLILPYLKYIPLSYLDISSVIGEGLPFMDSKTPLIGIVYLIILSAIFFRLTLRLLMKNSVY